MRNRTRPELRSCPASVMRGAQQFVVAALRVDRQQVVGDSGVVERRLRAREPGEGRFLTLAGDG
eukprot:7137042-Pyramimonas_sp.AAC.1